MTPTAVRLYLSGGRTTMDRVSESLLNEFSKEHNIETLPEDKRFEHFASYITVSRHHRETFDTDDVVTGSGGDTGIDSIAIIVNGSLVTDVESLEEQAEKSGHLDATFVFVQAERSASFDALKIGGFGYGVLDFFSQTPQLKRNTKITEAAEVMTALYKRSSKFNHGNPVCILYYVTTGKWIGDQNLEARRKSVIIDLENGRMFRDVQFHPIDADSLQRLYRQTKNAISKEFNFVNKTVMPDIPGVQESYLGYMPATEFLKLVTDEGGEMLGLFYDNVRDWLDFNEVNNEIRGTLESDARVRFVLMNNGVTIIARTLKTTGNKFLIEDYSVVNGCQTSHVLFDQKDKLDASVMVPVRLISTQDENIINAVIRATNRQTEVKEEQFFALQEFSKSLESYFQTFPEAHRLFYERRSRQYHHLDIEKTRIVTPANMIKAYAAMFLGEPHRTTRSYAALKANVGREIFVKDHRIEPYYAAAFTLYKLEYLFRTGRLEAKYKPARFHILLAARALANPADLPRQKNSHEMEKYCKPIMEKLWVQSTADELLTNAAHVIEKVAKGDFNRDNIRTEAFTDEVLKTLGVNKKHQ